MNANVIPIGITLYSRNLPEDVWVWLVCVVVVLRHFQQYFSYEIFAMANCNRGSRASLENKRPTTTHWQILSQNVLSPTKDGKLNVLLSHSKFCTLLG